MNPALRGSLRHDNEALLDLDLGWRPNPAGVQQVLASLPHPGELYAAAPDWIAADDGMTGDHMPYLAFLETELKNPNGTIWKAKGDEPPYIPQVGNNCTSRGLGGGLDLIQCIAIADPDPNSTETLEFTRVCVEGVYAFGLYKAGMRGDNGCYGGAIAQAANELGCFPYDVVDGVDEEERARLLAWANNPRAVVEKFSTIAAAFKVGAIARVTTWAEVCAAIANKRIVTTASGVGYVGSRDSRGIIRRRGRWMHQMFLGGIIRSDGVESAVQFNSWGRNNPTGPQPFRLPSFSWRTVREDVEEQLSEGDCWSVGLFPGFRRAPLPSRWTNEGWAA